MNGSAIVSAAIADVNELLEDGSKIEDQDDFALLGSGPVDSLTFINLVSAIEDRIQEAHGKTVVMVDESLLDDSDQVFATVGSLKAHVETLLG